MPSRTDGILDGGGDSDRDSSPSAWMLLADRTGGGLPAKRSVVRWLKSLFIPKRGSPGPERPLRPTAYLDGLRGFAAFLVYWHHHELWAHVSMPEGGMAAFENAFGWDGKFYLASFYGLRNFFSGGHMAVATFYVISGYVLSMKPLALIHAEDHLKVADNLGSALFRRWFRLYIPLIVTTFAFMTSWHVFGYWNSSCEPEETYGKDLWKWYVEFKNFSFIFKEGGHPWICHNPHLWSIPLEMRGSVIVYTCLLALQRASTQARLWCLLGLAIYFMYIVDGYYGALFIAGMLHCDLDLLARKPDGEGFPRWLRRLEPYKTFIYYHFFFLSIFLAGVPSQNDKIENLRASPGWYWLSFLKPQAVYDYKWFYLFWAANLLVAAIPRIGWLKRFFETRFCQYLGRISFSLYLVHGPILAVLGDRIYFAVGWVRHWEKDEKHLGQWANLFPLSKAGPMGLEPAFLLPHIILLPITLWAADLVTRAVDEPAVRFASWLYSKTLAGPTPPKIEDSARLA